jgi:hypothetical protein
MKREKVTGKFKKKAFFTAGAKKKYIKMRKAMNVLMLCKYRRAKDVLF